MSSENGEEIKEEEIKEEEIEHRLIDTTSSMSSENEVGIEEGEENGKKYRRVIVPKKVFGRLTNEEIKMWKENIEEGKKPNPDGERRWK